MFRVLGIYNFVPIPNEYLGCGFKDWFETNVPLQMTVLWPFLAIFHKTEVQAVILRCLTGLNSDLSKSYDTKHNYFHFCLFAILYKKVYHSACCFLLSITVLSNLSSGVHSPCSNSTAQIFFSPKARDVSKNGTRYLPGLFCHSSCFSSFLNIKPNYFKKQCFFVIIFIYLR